MKKLFLLLATVAVAFSCTETNLDNGISAEKEAKSLTFSLSLAGGDTSTRISISEDTETQEWLTAWDDNDKVGGLAIGDYMFDTYTMVEKFSDKEASFQGYTYGTQVRLVYPAPGYSVNVANNIYSISLSSQNVSMDTFGSMTSTTYMVADDVLDVENEYSDNEVTAPAMKHIGTAIELNLRFENIPDGSTASISKIEVGGYDGISIPTGADLDLSLPYSDEDMYTATGEGSMSLSLDTNTVANYDGTDATEYTVPFNALPFAVEVGETIVFTIYVNCTDSEGTTSVMTATVSSSNSGAEAASFEAGYYSSINKIVNMSDAVIPGAPFIVTNQDVQAVKATFTVEIDNTVCDGFAYDWGYTSWGSAGSWLESDIKDGNTTFITESSDIVMGNDYFMSTNTSYTIAIAPVKSLGNGSYEMSGDIEYFEFTTKAFELGASEITLAPATVEPGITSISYRVENNDDVSGLYYGYVLASKVTDGIEAYVENYFATESYPASQSFCQYDYNTSGYSDVEYLDISISYLDSSTEYYIFTVAVTANGNIGSPSYELTSTTSIVEDSSLEPIITVTPSSDSATVEIDLNNCAKVFVYNVYDLYAYQTDAQIKTMFIDDLSSMYYGYDTSDVVDGTISYTETDLYLSSAYTLYYMGVSADGALGDIKTIAYKTTGLSYESDAAINVTIDDASGMIVDAWDTML